MVSGLGTHVVIVKKGHFLLDSRFLQLLAYTAEYRSSHVPSKELFKDKRKCFLWTFGAFTDAESTVIEGIG